MGHVHLLLEQRSESSSFDENHYAVSFRSTYNHHHDRKLKLIIFIYRRLLILTPLAYIPRDLHLPKVISFFAQSDIEGFINYLDALTMNVTEAYLSAWRSMPPAHAVGLLLYWVQPELPINAPDGSGTTALSYAAQYGFYEAVVLLLSHKDIIRAPSEAWSHHPLWLACEHG